jgi:hypothetical protein
LHHSLLYVECWLDVTPPRSSALHAWADICLLHLLLLLLLLLL